MIWTRTGVATVAIALVLAVGSSAAFSSAGKLRKAQQAARDRYFAELELLAGTDPILDSASPTLKNRLVQPVDNDFQKPKYSGIQSQCEAIVAYIVERDGTITHAKVIWSYGPSRFADLSLAAVQAARYEQPGQVDNKPVRLFTYRIFTMFVGT